MYWVFSVLVRLEIDTYSIVSFSLHLQFFKIVKLRNIARKCKVLILNCENIYLLS